MKWTPYFPELIKLALDYHYVNVDESIWQWVNQTFVLHFRLRNYQITIQSSFKWSAWNENFDLQTEIKNTSSLLRCKLDCRRLSDSILLIEISHLRIVRLPSILNVFLGTQRRKQIQYHLKFWWVFLVVGIKCSI